MSGWKDATSYSSGRRGKDEPSTFELDHLGLRIVVHRWHGLDGLWFGSCHAMGVQQHQLTAADVTKAQAEFVAYLLARAQNWADKLGKVKFTPTVPK